MSTYYKSQEGERLVRERYLTFLKYWPVPNEHLRVPTREGETFVIASGDPASPPLVLFHGGLTNSVTWMPDVAVWAKHFRVYAVDMIGEPGFSAPSRPNLATEAYALWLDDVMKGLSVNRTSLVGVSLGGWLALDYATRRPEFVEKLAVLCPAGVGRQKMGFLFKMLFLRLLGTSGRRKSAELVLGRAPATPSPAVKAFGDFLQLIRTHFRPRMDRLPVFSDAMLQRLTMPVLAILGGKDVLLDSPGTRDRLRRNCAQADVRFYPQAGHFIPGQTTVIEEFLLHRKPR
jgi:pimeloyl-ACP methyl ester carboxylesterase